MATFPRRILPQDNSGITRGQTGRFLDRLPDDPVRHVSPIQRVSSSICGPPGICASAFAGESVEETFHGALKAGANYVVGVGNAGRSGFGLFVLRSPGCWATEKTPGFEVALVLLALAAGGEHEVAFEGDEYGGGHDVPGVFEDDVDGEEIHLAAGVVLAAAGADAANVSVAEAGYGGFDLDAQEVSVVFDGDIVALGVSPGLGVGSSLEVRFTCARTAGRWPG